MIVESYHWASVALIATYVHQHKEYCHQQCRASRHLVNRNNEPNEGYQSQNCGGQISVNKEGIRHSGQ